MRRTLFTLSVGLIAGILGSLLLLRAGFPPAFAGVVLWLLGGLFGLAILQYAFLSNSIQRAAEISRRLPLRTFLIGLLALEIPVLAASFIYLVGGIKAAALLPLLVVVGLLVVFWPGAISYQIGQRLVPDSKAPQQVLAGSLVAGGSLLLPIFGWLWLLVLAVQATGACCLRGRYA